MAKKKQVALNDIRDILSEISQWAVLAFLALFPLLPGTKAVYGNITVSKFIYFLIFLGIYIVAVVFAFAKWNTARRQLRVSSKNEKNATYVEQSKWKLSVSQILIVVYMLWSFISACVSKYSWEDKLIGQSRYEGLIAIFAYGILFLLVSEFAEHENVFIYGIAIMGIVMGLISTMQCFGSKILYPGDYNFFNSMFLGTIGHADCYAGLVSMIIPILVCSYVVLNLKKDWLLLVSAGLLLYVQLFSDVDSGKIGLLAAFVVAMPFILDTPVHIAKAFKAFAVMCMVFGFYGLFGNTTADRVVVTVGKKFLFGAVAAVVLFVAGIILSKKNIKLPAIKTMRIIIIAIIVVAILAASIFVFTYKGEKQLLKEASMLMHGELTDTMGTIRGYIWKSTFKIIKNHSLVGSGPGTFADEFIPYNEGYEVYAPGVVVDFAHNDYLQIAVCQGVIGLVIYLAFVISVLVSGVKKSLENPTNVIYLTAAVGFLAHTLFGFSIAIISPIFWIIVGLLSRRNTETV